LFRPHSLNAPIRPWQLDWKAGVGNWRRCGAMMRWVSAAAPDVNSHRHT